MRAVLTTLFLSALSLPAFAADLEAVEVDISRNRLVLSGNDLVDVTDVTLTDATGVEATLTSVTRTTREGTTIRAKLPDDTPGAYRLRIYDGATLEDSLDLNIPGAATLAARSMVTQISASNTCTGTTCSVTAFCPRGYRVLAGGYEKVGYYDTTIEANYPSGGTGWTVDAKAINSKAFWTEVQAYATCMRSE